jgi:LacI family transcriptional regulator
MSDELLIGTMQAIYKMKWTVPDDVAVLSISNGFLPALFNPSITYVETSGYELGKISMQRMIDFLGGQTFSRSIIVPSRLVEGNSMA